MRLTIVNLFHISIKKSKAIIDKKVSYLKFPRNTTRNFNPFIVSYMIVNNIKKGKGTKRFNYYNNIIKNFEENVIKNFQITFLIEFIQMALQGLKKISYAFPKTSQTIKNLSGAQFKINVREIMQKWKKEFIENDISEPKESIEHIIAYTLGTKNVSSF